MSEARAVALADVPARRFTLPVGAALAAGFGGLMLLVALALWVTSWSARDSAITLIVERNQRIVATLVDRLHNHLREPETVSAALANMIGRTDGSVIDDARLRPVLRVSIETAPEMTALAYVALDRRSFGFVRDAAGTIQPRQGVVPPPRAGDRERMNDATQGFWGDLIWSREFRQPLLTLRTPVRRDGTLLGVLLASVSVGGLSRELTDATGESQSFILYGRERVLAHQAFAQGQLRSRPQEPLPRLDEIGDKVLAGMWTGRVETPGSRLIETDALGHIARVDGRDWVFVYREVQGYGEEPLQVGRYYPFDDVDAVFARVRLAAWFSAGVLLLTLLAAILAGRAIGGPVRRLAAASTAIRDLDFDRASTLKPSRLRELDDASRAFESMRGALSSFGTYVPKQLVRRLMQRERGRPIRSQEREVTIMFTDIVGFAHLAQSMTAIEVATLLNDHFALIAGPIDDTDGTIDKYIGDAVMATWGAVEPSADHAARALRAARAIARAIAEDNRLRRGRGLAPIRARIGVHTGMAVVGNIGAEGRINYTLVGDAVNTAQRLEDLGHGQIGAADDAIVLASEESVAASGEAPGTFLGEFPLRGRSGTVRVHRLA